MTVKGECQELVVVGYRRHGDGADDRQIMADCGSWRAGTMVFCDRCQRRYEREYPQGWRGYPGDVCKHGRYTGGCGADLMCGACESGEGY
jgi:hypothetical protein